jgi:hypothetical protein
MFIPDPDFFPSRISDPRSKKKKNKKKRKGKQFLTYKIFTKLSEILVGNPRSGIRKKNIPDPDPGVTLNISSV